MNCKTSMTRKGWESSNYTVLVLIIMPQSLHYLQWSGYVFFEYRYVLSTFSTNPHLFGMHYFFV